MPDIALHQLPPAKALTGAEAVPVDDGSATVRTTVGAIRDGLAPTVHIHAIADVSGLQNALNAKAASASPSFTGTTVVNGSLLSSDLNLASRLLVVANAYYAEGWKYRGNGPAMQVTQFPNDGGVHFYTAPVNAAGPDVLTDMSPQMSIQHTPNAVTVVTLTGGAPSGQPAVGSTSGRIEITAIPHIPSYTTATLPVATARGLIFVANGSNNRRLAVADGTAWRWPDGTVVS